MNYREEHYARVGDPIPVPRPSVYELVVDDHVSPVGGVSPVDYFVTSGDAVSKARVLQRDLAALGTEEADVQSVRAGDLVRMLVEVRGPDVFLEVEWNTNHQLLCIPKNPRSRPDV